MNPFNYLRRKAAEAIVLGTADGLRAVTPDGESPPTDLGELRLLMATSSVDVKAIAAPSPDLIEGEPSVSAKGKARK